MDRIATAQFRQTGESGDSAAEFRAPDPTFHTLHDLLVSDLALRLNIDPEALQLTFSPEDETLISLAEPLFKFDVRPSRARALGNVSWDVTVFAGTSSKKVIVSAVARAWENQIVVVRPLAAHQLLAGTDFATNRVLVDSLPDHPLLRMDQCVGELAAQDLPPGTVMTALLVDPVPLVRSGELVTVTLDARHRPASLHRPRPGARGTRPNHPGAKRKHE